MKQTKRTLTVLKYLWEQTDEENTASLEQIKDHLESCGLSRHDFRTLKNDIEQLISFGIDIVKDRRVQNRYFVGSRQFDMAEIKLLIDAVQSSKFITQSKSKALIAKLGVFVEPRQKSLFNRQLYIDYRDYRPKADNEAILRIVDCIHTAILPYCSSFSKMRYFKYQRYIAFDRMEGY